jgi:hypothetical protein
MTIHLLLSFQILLLSLRPGSRAAPPLSAPTEAKQVILAVDLLGHQMAEYQVRMSVSYFYSHLLGLKA